MSICFLMLIHVSSCLLIFVYVRSWMSVKYGLSLHFQMTYIYCLQYNTCATNQRSLPQNTQSMQMQQWQLQALQPTNMWATSSQPTFLTTPNSIYFRGKYVEDLSGK